jgi:hypothetical protein
MESKGISYKNIIYVIIFGFILLLFGCESKNNLLTNGNYKISGGGELCSCRERF